MTLDADRATCASKRSFPSEQRAYSALVSIHRGIADRQARGIYKRSDPFAPTALYPCRVGDIEHYHLTSHPRLRDRRLDPADLKGPSGHRTRT